MRVTPDSKFIVSSSYDKTLRVIDLERRDYRIIDKIHVGNTDFEIFFVDIPCDLDWINCLAIPQDYRFIATASADRTIKLVDFWTEEPLCKFEDLHRG